MVRAENMIRTIFRAVADIFQARDSILSGLRLYPSCLWLGLGRHRKQTHVLIRLFPTMSLNNRLRTVQKHCPDHRFSLLLRHCSFLLSALGCQSHQRSISSWQREKHHLRYDGRSSTFWFRHWHGLGWSFYWHDWLAMGLPCRCYHQLLHVHPCCMAIASHSFQSQTSDLVTTSDRYRLAGTCLGKRISGDAFICYLVRYSHTPDLSPTDEFRSALTGDLTMMKQPVNITLLVLSFVFLAAFVLWVGRQERLGRPALIPNSLWQHKGFSCICFNVFCVWAAFNAFEQYANFFFQDVQGNSPLGTALRFLPAPVSGALANIGVGLLVHRIRGDWIVVLTSIVSALASLLMAIIDPSWSYFRCAFVAQFFNPVGADGMFTVANLLITSMFPPGEQGVAGGVFNTISQTGKSVGMALTLLIAQQVTANSSHEDKTSPEALMVGYRAAFWFCVALIVSSLLVSVWGLRRIGKVGLKKD
jgi:hypothetical protein